MRATSEPASVSTNQTESTSFKENFSPAYVYVIDTISSGGTAATIGSFQKLESVPKGSGNSQNSA